MVFDLRAEILDRSCQHLDFCLVNNFIEFGLKRFHVSAFGLDTRLDFRRFLLCFLESGLPSSPRRELGEERGFLSRTAAGNRAYLDTCDPKASWNGVVAQMLL